MPQPTPLADLNILRKGQLQDSLPGGLSVGTMRHAPKGVGHGLIIAGGFALVIGAWLAIGSWSWPDVLLNETAHISVPAVKHDGKTPLPSVDVPVPAAGRYILVSRPAGDDLRQLPMLSELDQNTAVEARADSGRFIATSTAFEQRNLTSTQPHDIFAVPADNAPTRVDVPRLVRNLAIATVGLALVVTGVVLGRRRRDALQAYARSIEASLVASAAP